MPILDADELSPAEDRQNIIGEALLDTVPVIPGVVCQRGITPLVMMALRRANNPFITNRKGFEAIGIEFDSEGKQLTEPADFAMALMPKTAEFLLLLSCSHEQLKQFATTPAALLDAALDLLGRSTMEEMMQGTLYISELLKPLAKARAVPSAEDEAPEASAIANRGKKKKPGPTG